MKQVQVMTSYDVVLEWDPDERWFTVSCPSLPGCHSQGRTETSALANITDAIRLYLQIARVPVSKA